MQRRALDSLLVASIIRPHPDRATFLARASALGRVWDRPSALALFRFINPQYSSAADILSGEGALHAAGRWNPPGSTLKLSYTAAEPETALAETLAHARYFRLPSFSALPRVLVGLRLRATRVLDLRDGTLRRRLRLSLATILDTDWRKNNRGGQEAVTQAWGSAFGAAGFEAVVAPSSALPPGGTNVLIFPGKLLSRSRLVVDQEVHWT